MFHQVNAYAIFADNSGGTFTADLTITHNSMSSPGAGSLGGIRIASGGNASVSDAITTWRA